MVGYFQNYKYIDPVKDEFLKMLSFNISVLSKYPNLQNSIFLHIRGGDYLIYDVHNVNLSNYYSKCLEQCTDPIVVFTNDANYANKILSGKQYTIINESDIDSLYLMSQCKGGICANSSFSWWGAYLNTNRKLFLPSKWYNDPSMNISGYYFNGCTIIDV